MLQTLFFMAGCLGGVVVFVWAYLDEQSIKQEQRKKARDAFGKTP